MSLLLILAIVSMIGALTFYSIGVWGERFSKVLKPVHLIFFWIGFAFDTIGTTLMGEISGKFSFNIHAVTGLAALILMAVHAVWATVVIIKRQESTMKSFHRFSLLVWSLWLIPFVMGLIIANLA